MTARTVLNPFVVGGAIGGQNGRGFVGREDIFSFVTSALMVERRAPILLHGQRRIGKSSILKQIPRHLPPDFACVYFDLQGTAAMKTDQLLYGLGLAISDRLGMTPPEREDCVEDRFPAVLKRAVESLGGHQEKLVLLFDEFDVIDQSVKGTEVAASRFIPYLAGLTDQFPGIGYILVVGRKTEELSPEFFGSLLRVTVTKQIGRLTESQVKGLARDLAAGHLNFDDTSLARIYFLTRGHPFCAQALCNVIWNLATDGDRPFPVPVTAELVDRALLGALEVWSNGLNWVYDGMSKPSYRLVLSALAEAADPLAGGTASLDKIDSTLRSRHMTLDRNEFAIAVSDMLKWDILVGPSSGLAFAVPMIGSWIANNRALEVLRGQSALTNPRAQRYYDLALENLNQDNFDAAIGDFRNMLAASPDSLDALRGLSRAFSLRHKPGDLADAAEAYERLLGLDPDEPRTALVEILADRIDEGGAVAEISAAFRRVKELDAGGNYQERAARRLVEAAHAHEARGSSDDLKIAASLYSALDDPEGAARATNYRRTWSRLAGTAAALLFLLSLLWGWFDRPSLGTVRGLFPALSGSLWGSVLDGGAARARRLRSLAAIPAGCTFGALGYWFAWERVWWVLLGAVGGLLFFGVWSVFVSSPPPDTRISLTKPSRGGTTADSGTAR